MKQTEPNKIPYPKRFKKDQEALDNSKDDHDDIINSQLLKELKKINIEIPLLQAIKDIPKTNNMIKTLSIKTLGRKKRMPPIIQVGAKITDVLDERSLPQKYSDPRTYVIKLKI